jgi:endogenous inhibitor of DNA gyrase (YacG/DUF329 family)
MPPRVCVFCRRHPVDPEWRPFCSERCKMQDLARWADGTYRVAAEPIDDAEGDDDSLTSESDL